MKRKLLRVLTEAWESGDANAVAHLYSTRALFLDGVGRGGKLARGQNAIRTVVREMFGLPGARFRVTSLSSTKDGCVAEWTHSWKAGRPGRRNQIRGASVIVVRKGKVIREYSYYNPEPEIS